MLIIRTKKTALIVSFLCFFPLLTSAQSLNWQGGYNGFFDNREYFNAYVEPQTMFGSHVFASAGIALNEYQKFVAGADLLYEFGGEVSGQSVNPILYFNFKKDFMNVFLGAFPRNQLVSVPQFMLNDTMHYYRPHVEGIFLEAKQKWGSHNVWLDWTSRQTDINREIFQLGGTGNLKFGSFFYQHHFIMTHYAGPAIPIPDDHIRDNGGASVNTGLQFTNIFFDSISMGTGYIFNYDRLRNVYDSTHHGSISQIYLEKYGIGIRTSHYFGSGQVFMSGDGLYKAPSYQRIDLVWKIFRSKQVQGKVEFSFHIVDEVLDMSQSFTIYANLERRKKLPGTIH